MYRPLVVRATAFSTQYNIWGLKSDNMSHVYLKKRQREQEKNQIMCHTSQLCWKCLFYVEELQEIFLHFDAGGYAIRLCHYVFQTPLRKTYVPANMSRHACYGSICILTLKQNGKRT